MPLGLILGAFTAIDYIHRRQATLANLSLLAAQTSTVIENSLQQVMLAGNSQGIQSTLAAIGRDKTISVAYLLDTSGRVVFAARAEEIGQRLDNHDSACQPCHRLPATARPPNIIVRLSDGRRVFRSMNPIRNQPECHGCHDASQRLNGVLLTDISMAPLEASLAADLREEVAWWVGTILTIVLVVNLGLSRTVIRRLEQVAQGLARFGQGQLDLRLPTDSPDEIGQLAAAFNEMGQRLQREAAGKQALSEDLRRQGKVREKLLKRLITAQEEERRRVARDLHDDLGQDLAGLAAHLEAVERMWADHPEEALQQIRQTRTLIAESTERAYALILSLRPSVLDDLGLAAALRAHAERALKGSAIQFELDAHLLARRLPPEIETTLFRTFQEALSNVIRHSGARMVRMSLAAYDGAFEAEIVDDGCGFDLQSVQMDGLTPRGLGLLGMQERLAQCGGSLAILSQPGAGTRIRIHVPLPEESHA